MLAYQKAKGKLAFAFENMKTIGIAEIRCRRAW